MKSCLACRPDRNRQWGESLTHGRWYMGLDEGKKHTLDKFYFILLKRQGYLPSAELPLHCPPHAKCEGWSRLKTGARNFCQVSLAPGQQENKCPLPERVNVSRKLDQNQRSQNSKQALQSGLQEP